MNQKISVSTSSISELTNKGGAFYNCMLDYCDLSEDFMLRRCIVSNSRVDTKDASIVDTLFMKCDFKRGLFGSVITSTFEECNLTHMLFNHDVKGIFSKCDFTGSVLMDDAKVKADFWQCIGNGTDIHHVTLSDGTIVTFTDTYIWVGEHTRFDIKNFLDNYKTDSLNVLELDPRDQLNRTTAGWWIRNRRELSLALINYERRPSGATFHKGRIAAKGLHEENAEISDTTFYGVIFEHGLKLSNSNLVDCGAVVYVEFSHVDCRSLYVEDCNVLRFTPHVMEGAEFKPVTLRNSNYSQMLYRNPDFRKGVDISNCTEDEGLYNNPNPANWKPGGV